MSKVYNKIKYMLVLYKCNQYAINYALACSIVAIIKM